MPKITKILRITQSWDSNPDFHYAAFLKVDFFLKKVLFVYFIEREGERACTSRVCVWGGRGRWRGGGRESQGDSSLSAEPDPVTLRS